MNYDNMEMLREAEQEEDIEQEYPCNDCELPNCKGCEYSYYRNL